MKKIIVTLLSLYLTNNLADAQERMANFDKSGRVGYVFRYIRVQGANGDGARCIYGNRDVYIKGFRGYSDRTYQNIHVWESSDYIYETVIGSVRRIPGYVAFSSSDEEAFEQFKQNVYQQAQEEHELRSQQEADRVKMFKTSDKVIQNMKEQATNGLPTFQYQLGVSYVTGANGETNKALGRIWLIRSAAQGNEDAANYLKELK